MVLYNNSLYIGFGHFNAMFCDGPVGEITKVVIE